MGFYQPVSAIGITAVGGIIEDFTEWDVDAPPATAGAPDDEFDGAAGAGAPPGWTEIDHGATVTVSEDEHGLTLTQATLAGADSVGGIYKALPAGNFSIEARMSLSSLMAGACFSGLALFQDATSAAGDIDTWGLAQAGSEFAFYRLYWDAYNSIGGQENAGAIAWMALDICFRIRRTGTTYVFDVGMDGYGFLRIATTAALGFVPTHFGVVIDNRSSTADAKLRVRYIRYTGSDVGVDGMIGGDRIEVGRN